MREVLDGILLGSVQGITEFLPVSSSGHLTLLQKFLGLSPSSLIPLDIIVHIITLGIIIYFTRHRILEILKGNINLFYFVIVGSIPAGIVGIFFQNSIEVLFNSTIAVGINFFISAGIILLGSIYQKYNEKSSDPVKFSFFEYLLTGVAQALAILPGVSRSGATISTLFVCGIKGKDAIEYSFLLAVPAMAGAALLKLKQMVQIYSINPTMIISASLATLFTGIFSYKFLIWIVKKANFIYFSLYCLIVGLLCMYFR